MLTVLLQDDPGFCCNGPQFFLCDAVVTQWPGFSVSLPTSPSPSLLLSSLSLSLITAGSPPSAASLSLSQLRRAPRHRRMSSVKMLRLLSLPVRTVRTFVSFSFCRSSTVNIEASRRRRTLSFVVAAAGSAQSRPGALLGGC